MNVKEMLENADYLITLAAMDAYDTAYVVTEGTTVERRTAARKAADGIARFAQIPRYRYERNKGWTYDNHHLHVIANGRARGGRGMTCPRCRYECVPELDMKPGTVHAWACNSCGMVWPMTREEIAEMYEKKEEEG